MAFVPVSSPAVASKRPVAGREGQAKDTWTSGSVPAAMKKRQARRRDVRRQREKHSIGVPRLSARPGRRA
eukprot:3028113-Lingulodinium_polyedra.AAC.1